MTRTEIERIAVLETKLDTVSETVSLIDLKLDHVIEGMGRRVEVLEDLHVASDIREAQRNKYLGVSRSFFLGAIALANGLLAIFIAWVNLHL